MYNKILVPLDGSGRAEAILKHVEILARCLGSQIIFLRVLEPLPPLIDPGEAPVMLNVEEMKREAEEAERYLRARQGEWRSMGLDARTRIAQGPIVKTILDVAQAEDVDLIAMASHGRTGLAHLFYGSVALGVLHRTDRPVLLVRSIDDGGR
ncbi:MAG TPA: universal stress protein [Aggregatilineales bacterium]|nr:universal stress protein [Chloroflexota bacterium]HOA25002.1 universal stress protein [Aggregatilineales bacterium]HPV08529.1 universal stress protein [Aggregatilineales bacterium]HQA67884.1 universal stress protein [Aggregatilineales bacterium]HQE18768.1 universal stress protein [Aggregatilineales bacterium]